MKDLEEKVDTRLRKHEKQLDYLTDKVDFFVRTSLPPVEGIFYDGQIFDAYKFEPCPGPEISIAACILPQR